MNTNQRKAFTLIELLVVIVLVGILSSISVSTFQNYRERARIAKAQFSARQLQSLILAQDSSTGEGTLFTFWYGFDEGTINPISPFVLDKSEVGNNLINSGASGTFNSDGDTPIATGRSIRLENRQLFRLGGVTTQEPDEKITVATWIKFDDIPVNSFPYYSFVAGQGSTGFRVFANGDTYFYINSGANRETITQTGLETGKWYYLVGSYDGSTQRMKFWIDGDLVGERDGVVQVGSLLGAGLRLGHPNFNGWLDETMFFPYAFDGEELQ